MVRFMARALRGLSVGLLGLVVVGLVVPARGQGPGTIGTKDLEDEVNKKENRDLIPKLVKGEVAADSNNPAHVEALNAQVRYLLFRFHDETYHMETKGPKSIERLYSDFDGDLSRLTKDKAKTAAALPLYTKALVTQGKLVLGSRLNITRVNVARCLARLPELDQADGLDLFVEVLADDGQLDAVKYHMLRGLADLLGHPKAATLLPKEAVEKAAAALTKFVQRPAKFPSGVSPQEVRAFQILRRDAIRALGLTRLPSLPDKSYPSVVLLKTMAGEGVTPPALMDERLEAAIALARVSPALDKDYCPDYAAEQIGRFLPTFATFALVENKQAKLPCKVYAARLQEGLQLLESTESKQPAAVQKYVSGVVKTAVPVLKLLQGDNPSSNQVGQFSDQLEQAVGGGGPNKSLFKDVPESALKGGS